MQVGKTWHLPIFAYDHRTIGNHGKQLLKIQSFLSIMFLLVIWELPIIYSDSTHPWVLLYQPYLTAHSTVRSLTIHWVRFVLSNYAWERQQLAVTLLKKSNSSCASCYQMPTGPQLVGRSCALLSCLHSCSDFVWLELVKVLFLLLVSPWFHLCNIWVVCCHCCLLGSDLFHPPLHSLWVTPLDKLIPETKACACQVSKLSAS